MKYLSALLCLVFVACASLPTTIDDIPERQYVALGDSVTAGVGAGGQFPKIARRNAYPYIVAQHYGVRHANLAVPTAKSDDVVGVQLIPALAMKPKVVTLWCGGNDLVSGGSASAYGENIGTLIHALQTLGAEVYVINLPNVWEAPRFVTTPDNDVTPERVRAFNNETEMAALFGGAILVDISGPELAKAEHLSSDGFHVGPSGHEFVAARVIAAMEQ